ncbi:hypothetical protein EG328_007500 [Venturia inaequalis]|uniref:BTB domain-containing protein n=1 Tax=Venturia inaequalis TaxID=5025 RepID=A0A8H3UDK4_VENIN|nr:hypothetical protein EG328_007500 [Venturia inaequalis]
MSDTSWKSDKFAPIKTAVLRGFDTGEYHDLILECQEYAFQAHKIVVCNQSPWLAKAVKDKVYLPLHSCKRTPDTIIQKKSAAIQLPEENAHVASAMLHYLYAATYSYPPTYHTLSTYLPPSMLFHLHLYTLADTLVIAPLKALAQSSFQESVKKEWSTPIFPDTIKRVYEITNGEDELRGIVVNTAAEHGKELMGKGGAFGVMMGEVAEFGRDVFHVMMGASSVVGVVEVPAVIEKEKMVAYRCPVCPFEFYAKAIGRREIACSGCGVVSEEGEWRGEKGEEIRENGCVVEDVETEVVGEGVEVKVHESVMEPKVDVYTPDGKIEWTDMPVNGERVEDTGIVKTPEAEPQEVVILSRDEAEAKEEASKTNMSDSEMTVEHGLSGEQAEEDVKVPIPEQAQDVVVEGEKEKNVSERADSANGDGVVGSAEVKESAGEIEEAPAFPKKKKGKKGKKSSSAVNALPTSPRATEAQIIGWGS